MSQFVNRHVGQGPDDVTAMLHVVGQPSMEALVDRAVPTDIRSSASLDLPAAATEPETTRAS